MRIKRERGKFNNKTLTESENKVIKETETRIQGILIENLFI